MSAHIKLGYDFPPVDDKIVYSEGIKSENYDKETLLWDKVIIMTNFILNDFLSHHYDQVKIMRQKGSYDF